jgi:hypothetical protein
MTQKVNDLTSAVAAIVTMLREDFKFTSQDEAEIASTMGKLRDAFGRWRQRHREGETRS